MLRLSPEAVELRDAPELLKRATTTIGELETVIAGLRDDLKKLKEGAPAHAGDDNW